MSMWFKLEVAVSDFNLAKQNDIVSAAREQWDFDVLKADTFVTTLYLNGEDKTSADPEGRIDEICAAIWKANDAYCKIEVRSVCLEELPWEDHVRCEEDYERLIPAKDPSHEV